MSTSSSILITGGGSGIGLGLAKRFHARGDTVLVTGRSASRLADVAAQLPGVLTFTGDLSTPDARVLLAEHVLEALPQIDVLINNAGIQHRVAISADSAPWSERQTEIDILLAAPVHLTSLLIPRMLANARPAQIVNVTSGGAYIPQPFAPTYSAAKAALHSYTENLRWSLAGSNVRVTELIPPAVATELAGPGNNHGADVDEFCDAVFPEIRAGRDYVGYGPTASADFLNRLTDDHATFERMASRFPAPRY